MVLKVKKIVLTGQLFSLLIRIMVQNGKLGTLAEVDHGTM